MKVVYLTEGYSPHDRRFMEAAASLLGHQVVYVPWRGRPARRPRELPSSVVWAGHLGALTPLRWRSWSRGLRRLFDQVKPDLIHAGPLPWGPLFPAWWGAWPLVSMSWGSDVLWHGRRKPWLRVLIRWVLRRSTLLLADCRAVADTVHAWGMPRQAIVVFPWGTDLDVFHPGTEPALRASWGWPEEAFVWVHARTWNRYYGADVALRGFLRAWRQEPRLRLVLLGGGPLESWLRREIVRHRAQGVVRIVGRVPEEHLARYFRAVDGYLSMSRSDGSSVTLLQALASGLPVVVSDIPGNREWVTSGVEGYLVPVGDVGALARALVQVARMDARDRAAMAQAARRRAETHADWKRHIRELDRAYRLAVEWETRRR